MKNSTLTIGCLWLFLLMSSCLMAQFNSYPFVIKYYPFIHYQKNKIEFPSDSSAFEKVNSKLHHLIQEGEGRLDILQIGGSHIQADIYSNVARYRLQHFYPGLNGGRGFVFPYAIAKTNNPVNLKVEYTGEWTSCRNVQKNKTCQLGLSGISVSTRDSVASFKLYSYKSYHHYDFNRVKIFYEFDDSLNYDMQLADRQLIDSVRVDSLNHFVEYFLNRYLDTLEVKLLRTDTFSRAFTFYGATLETDDPGIVYHSIGINGASIPSFLRCQLFQEQMSVIAPDMVVLSLGTNDAYGKTFDPQVYYANYDTLIQRIKQANPEVAILITVPNDDYLYKRYPNKFTALQEQEIYKLAQKHGAGVWNLYQIMGGFNSSQTWYNFNLMKYDRIHFTKEGYQLKGDLYFNAILRMYDAYIESLNERKSLLDID